MRATSLLVAAARLATAVSEIARNAFRYAGGGWMEVRVDGDPPRQSLRVRIRDQGPGIPREMIDRIFFPMVSFRLSNRARIS